jgi:hypothetical protein
MRERFPHARPNWLPWLFAEMQGGLGGLRAESALNLLDQEILHRQRLSAEADQTCDAAGRAQGVPVVHPTLEADEEIVRKQGLLGLEPTPAANTLQFDPGVEDLISLPHQVGFGTIGLSRLCLDEIPVGFGRDASDCLALACHGSGLLFRQRTGGGAAAPCDAVVAHDPKRSRRRRKAQTPHRT